MNNTSLLDDIVVSSFPVAIGTGLMLETLFSPTIARYDDSREIPSSLKVDDYKYHIYNIYTIVRNILTAIPHKNKQEILTDKHFRKYVADEVESIFNLYDGTKCVPTLYIPDYSSLITYYNTGKGKLNKYIEEHELMVKVVKGVKFMESIAIIPNNELKKGYKLPAMKEKVLITTSYTLDLHNSLPNMMLLESHTGKLKSKLEFSSKYKKSSSYDVSSLPYHEFIHYIVGDSTLVSGIKVGYKKQLFKIAEDKKWTPRTTNDKIVSNIKDYSPDLYSLLSMFKNQY